MSGHLSSSAKKLVEDVDRLSSLPPEIRVQILSLLPTIDAARVGLLSKSLRSACCSLSRFSFDYHQFPEFPETKDKLFSFVNFIDQTIAHHDESDVTTLELRLCPIIISHVPIKSLWVRFAIKHRVEKLVLYGRIDKMNLLDRLFTCQTLVKLELDIVDLVLSSEKFALPNLQKLKLKFLVLADQTLGNDSFPNLPALRKLSMFDCFIESDGDVSISFEKLEEFIMCCSSISGSALKLQSPCLSSFIYINDKDQLDLDVHPSRLQFIISGINAPPGVSGSINELCPSLIKVTKEFFKTTHLSLNHWLIEHLSMAHYMLKHATRLHEFHSISMLEIGIWPIMDHLTVLILLVSRCPMLREIILVLKTPQRRALQLLNEDSLAEYGTMGGLCSVRRVIIVKFRGDETEMMLVRFLLANMIELRLMSILTGDFTGRDRELTIFEILQFEKASEFVEIEFHTY